MTKISRRPLQSDELGLYINNLWSAFVLMSSKEDMRLLCNDLLTPTEYPMLAKRFEIARRLLAGQGYEQIERELKVTPGTITKVSNILAEKGEGLRKACQRLESITNRKKKQSSISFPRLPSRSTAMGVVLKAGVQKLDDLAERKSREQSAKKQLLI